MLFSLVIPTYNERPNIAPLVRRVTATLAQVTESFEVIVVDDDSPDETWKVAEGLARENGHLRVIRRQGEKGLATAVVAGWQAAQGEILGVMDGDLQHPPEIVAKLLDTSLHAGADVVVASRHVSGGGTREWSAVRRVISWGAASLATLMLPDSLQRLRDPMSGCFLLRRSVIEAVQLKPQGYKILVEVLARGTYQTVLEVPYTFETRKEGKSKLGLKQYGDFLLHLGRLARETGHLGRFLRFCVVGLSGVVVNEGALWFFTAVGGLYYVYASLLAVELAIVNNFLLNDRWTFRERSRQQPGLRNYIKRFWQFNLICGVGALLNVVVLWALTAFAGVYYLLSNLVGIGVSTLWNYGLNSMITWRAPAKHKGSEALIRKPRTSIELKKKMGS
jgi:dolichol-phosphate mannosyltransferase